MKKFLYILKFILLFIWQLPQNIVALLMLFWFKFSFQKTEYMLTNRYAWVFKSKGMGLSSVSLGSFCFICWNAAKRPETIQHELGHTWWSHVLGPLYLIIIGIPSALWNISYKKLGFYNYYEFYPEHWANIKGYVEAYNYYKNYWKLRIIKDILGDSYKENK